VTPPGSAPFDPLSSDLIVADEPSALKITLFPRRLVPGLVGWGIVNAILLFVLADQLRPSEAHMPFLVIACSLFFSLYPGCGPYRAVFELDEYGLSYEASPSFPVGRLEISLSELGGFSALTEGRVAFVGFRTRNGALHRARAFGMTAEQAAVIASMLQRRLDELRERGLGLRGR
jgi:hypothetical protein